MDSPEPIIVLEGVAKDYEEAGRPHPVLRDVSVAIAEGEVVAILGRSGSGKSTFLNLVAGIDQPSAGSVLVAGRPIHRLSERERTLFRRAQIGFVYQFFNLIPTLTVLENVSLPLELNGRGREAAARAGELLAAVGLAERGASYPDRLSGGEQQRVALARALAAEPRIVLADEPTGNLDAEIGERVLALLIRLTRDRGRTLVMATHSRRVARAADRVLSVEDHRLVPLPAGAPDAEGLLSAVGDPTRLVPWGGGLG